MRRRHPLAERIECHDALCGHSRDPAGCPSHSGRGLTVHLLFTTSAVERPRGGSEFLWLQAAQRLVERGVRVTAAARWRPDACAALDRIAAAGGTVIRLPTQSLHVTIPVRIARRLKVTRIPGE